MEDAAFQDAAPAFTAPSKKSPKRFIYLVIGVIVVVLIFVLYSRFASSSKEETKKSTPTPTVAQNLKNTLISSSRLALRASNSDFNGSNCAFTALSTWFNAKERFPDAESMGNADPSEILEFIKSCSYPNSKANQKSS